MRRHLNFKWNPFTMKGEAPASMRWLTPEEERETEFASKEDLDAIMANPQLKKYYESARAGVTKKFQGWSDQTRQHQKTIEALQAELQEMSAVLDQWEQWRPEIERMVGERGRQPSNDGKQPGIQPVDKGKRGKGDDTGSDDRFDQLIAAITKAGQDYEKKFSKMSRMVNLSLQLQQLRFDHPKMDAAKVLDIAMKKGYDDLGQAYMDDEAYGKEEFQTKVDEALKPRLEEEKAKWKTNVETGSGAVPHTFQPTEDVAKKGWDQLGQEFLDEREKELGKG